MSNIPAATLSKMRPREFYALDKDRYFKYLEQMLIQIQGQTGLEGGELAGVPDVAGVVDPLVSSLDSELEIERQDYVITSSNITTSWSQFIVAAGELTVTLNPNPQDRERVVVHRNTDSDVSITDGVGTDILVSDQTVISYRFFQELGQWIRGA